MYRKRNKTKTQNDFMSSFSVFSLCFSSAGKGQFLIGIFKTTYIVLVNLQEVAGGKKFLKLLLGAVKFTGYRLIWRTLLCWRFWWETTAPLSFEQYLFQATEYCTFKSVRVPAEGIFPMCQALKSYCISGQNEEQKGSWKLNKLK